MFSRISSIRPRCGNSASGMTLVELLVALGVSLLLVLGLTQYFKFVGDTVAEGRAVIEMASQVYATTQRLQLDIDQVTPLARPGSDQAAAAGYLEIIEGIDHDFAASLLPAPNTDTILGDVDDVLAMVSTSDREPYSGQLLYTTKIYDPTTNLTTYSLDLSGTGPYQYEALRSRHAEVVYWVTLDDRNGNNRRDYGEFFILHRRNLLVLPNVRLDANSYGRLNQIQLFNISDLSCRFDNTGSAPIWRSNNIEDLTRRENRFLHTGPLVGLAAIPVQSDMVIMSIPPLFTARQGEDIVLSHLLAFDVRVYDPTAVVLTSTSGGVDAVSPGDPGFMPAVNANTTVLGRGAFVDLAYGRNFVLTAALQSTFSGLPDTRSRLGGGIVAYDTWSTSYERDGIDQDGVAGPDQGTDGLPNNSIGGIDDPTEQETSAPYPIALRGIQILVRVIDVDSRQVQQAIVSSDFTPE